MDDERPIVHFVGFLKLVAALFVIILSGLALVLGLIWLLSPEPAATLPEMRNGPVERLPAYEPESPPPADGPR